MPEALVDRIPLGSVGQKTLAAFNQSDELLCVKDLCTEFRGAREIVAVKHANFHIAPGEVLGLVGESGCGKSVLVKSLIRILPPNGYISGGQILWLGENL